jgi:hypothetical protein
MMADPNGPLDSAGSLSSVIGQELEGEAVTDQQGNCITILRHIVEADLRFEQAAEGKTWDYSKARDALRAAVYEARQFLDKQRESASEAPILREVDG